MTKNQEQDQIDFDSADFSPASPGAKPGSGGRPRSLLLFIYCLCACVAIAGIIIGAKLTPIVVSDATLLVASSVSFFFLVMLFPIAREMQHQRIAMNLMLILHREMSDALRSLANGAALSDDARRIVNRRIERDLLRRAIEEDIAEEDWDAAAVLCNELADQFGYRADAEELSRQIDRARFRTVERDVANAIAELDSILAQRNWAEATVAAIRIGRMYPDSPSVEGLRHRVAQVRSAYRSELEQRFTHAVDEQRPEDALDILEELDHYLTEAEAVPLMETARDVIAKAKEMLGTRFKAAIHERNWDEAQLVGDRIMRRFPNSRMSQEVHDVLATVRERAAS